MYIAGMSKRSVLFSPSAVESLRNLVSELQQASLIAGERTRKRLLQRIHLLNQKPGAPGVLVGMAGDKEIRMAIVLNYKLFFYLEGENIWVVDILTDYGD
jgi:hypothetical protein